MFAEWTTPRMRESRQLSAGVVAAGFRNSYWMSARHASNGRNLDPGDLFGSGKIFGPRDDSRACLAGPMRFGRSVIGELRFKLEGASS